MKAAELLKWRTKRGLTRKELATELGTNITTILRWETSARKAPPYLDLALKWLDTKEGGELLARSTIKTNKKETKLGTKHGTSRCEC